MTFITDIYNSMNQMVMRNHEWLNSLGNKGTGQSTSVYTTWLITVLYLSITIALLYLMIKHLTAFSFGMLTKPKETKKNYKNKIKYLWGMLTNNKSLVTKQRIVKTELEPQPLTETSSKLITSVEELEDLFKEDTTESYNNQYDVNKFMNCPKTINNYKVESEMPSSIAVKDLDPETQQTKKQYNVLKLMEINLTDLDELEYSDLTVAQRILLSNYKELGFNFPNVDAMDEKTLSKHLLASFVVNSSLAKEQLPFVMIIHSSIYTDRLIRLNHLLPMRNFDKSISDLKDYDKDFLMYTLMSSKGDECLTDILTSEILTYTPIRFFKTLDFNFKISTKDGINYKLFGHVGNKLMLYTLNANDLINYRGVL